MMQVSQALVEVYKAGYEDGKHDRGEGIVSVGEFLTGLSHADVMAVADDIKLYGNAFAETVNGKKRRIPPREWEGIIVRHELKRHDAVTGYDITKETRH
jgi:hypothetical protein